MGVTWGQRLGRASCPYLRRWVFNFGPAGSVRVHHWTASDDPRALHDHAWWFLTLVIKGGYTDATVNPPDEAWEKYVGMDHLHAGSVRYRSAYHAHSVIVDPGGCWTVMLTGPVSRDWGFWVDGTWMRMRKYFKLHGDHPCD